MAERSWSDMHHEILSSILVRLLARKDVTSFYGVCRSWRSVPFLVLLDPTSEKTQIPLLLVFLNRGLIHFSNPINMNNTIFTRSIVPAAAAELAHDDAEIRFSKHGWLLMSRGERRIIYFFNPFTSERIDLPDMPMHYPAFAGGLAFSSTPTSPDCVVFGATEYYCWERSDIRFIRHGDKSWTRLKADNNYDFIASNNNPVFHNGVFYCLGLKGNLGVFDPNKQVTDCWTVLTKPQTTTQPYCNSIQRRYIAKCNDDLILVLEGSCRAKVWYKVFKFDYSYNMAAWKEVQSLGKNMLFLSATTSFGLKSCDDHQTTKAAILETTEDKIYFPRFHIETKVGVFYSLVTRKLHTFNGGYASEDFYGTCENMNCEWIQPSYEVHTNEELQWCSPTDSDSDSDSDDEQGIVFEEEINRFEDFSALCF